MEYYFDELLVVGQTIEKLKNSIYQMYFEGEKAERLDEIYKSAQYHRYALGGSQRTYWDILSQITCLCEFFGIKKIDINRKGLENWITLLDNAPNSYKWKDFESLFANIEKVFQFAKSELEEKISLLEEEEKDRLNEAFNCYIQELNYSSIVMSVSAIENRLFSLMISKYPDKKLEELTLGQLIWEYTHNKERYGNIIPEKHEPLLYYCNNYRVFSVHPKKEKINRSNATIILGMSCSFLFDKNMKTKTEK